MLHPQRTLLCIILSALPFLAQAQVVINEILYHAPDDLDDLQFVELHNTGSEPVDMGGWRLTQGIKFTFPTGARIEGNGFLVICANTIRFQQFYKTPIAGVFESKLSRKGEAIELADASGKRVDRVKFGDRSPWPSGADGYSGSLERICPTSPGEDAANWISSPLSEDRDRPAGTPGQRNAGFSPALPPILKAVTFTPEWPAPGQAITVEAEMAPNQEVASVNLLFRQAGPGFEKEETRGLMVEQSPGHYTGTVPGQPAGQLVRFRVEATGVKGPRRFFPAPTEPRPALSACWMAPVEPGTIPFAWVVHTSEKEMKAAELQAGMPMFGGFGPPPNMRREDRPRPRGNPTQTATKPDDQNSPPPPNPPEGAPPGGPEGGEPPPFPFGGPGGPGRPGRPGGPGRPGFLFGSPFGAPSAVPGSHRSAFVYFDPESRKTELFDFVQVNGRKGGQKIHLHKDHPLQGMTTFALIFEGDIAALVEPLAYEVYRRAGMPVEKSYHLRLWQDGKPDGYTLLVEQPNGAFLRRNKIKDGGNMYKLLWFGGDLKGQHEKHSNRHEGHDDLLAVVAGLKKPAGADPWSFIREQFDVEEVATYFAVNMVLSHWDGFFNNYFTYHEPGRDGKWSMYPWDQDSTWGLRGGDGGNLFYDMPLTFGMTGDKRQSGGFWWRPPGWFSGPLLANPEFRKLYLGRIKHILESVYTEAVFGPVLDHLADQLTPEVRLRAEIHKQNPERAVEQLKSNLALCREHLAKRREFLLAQEELKAIQPAPAKR